MDSTHHPHKGQKVLHAGASLEGAQKVVILMHGRGASAEDIIRLGSQLVESGNPDEVAFLAPQAAGNTWYPYPFIAPIHMNEPFLTSALQTIDDLVDSATQTGLDSSRIVVGGFSQGACLSLEYAARGTRNIGGVIGFSGGVIGPVDEPHAELPNLEGLKVFIGSGTMDSHIPAERVQESGKQFEDAGASVDVRIYEGMTHTINTDEVEAASALIASV